MMTLNVDQSHGKITRSPSSASSWSKYASSMKAYVRRRRLWLSTLAVIVIIGMIIGIVLTTHYWVHVFGGQNFLSRRWPDRDNPETMPTHLFLPMRRISRSRVGSNRVERTIPFYVCGDQANSCEAYNQSVGLEKSGETYDRYTDTL